MKSMGARSRSRTLARTRRPTRRSPAERRPRRSHRQWEAGRRRRNRRPVTRQWCRRRRWDRKRTRSRRIPSHHRHAFTPAGSGYQPGGGPPGCSGCTGRRVVPATVGTGAYRGSPSPSSLVASATARCLGLARERPAATLVPPQLGHPPQQDGHSGHAGQPARPHGELRGRRWPRPRRSRRRRAVGPRPPRRRRSPTAGPADARGRCVAARPGGTPPTPRRLRRPAPAGPGRSRAPGRRRTRRWSMPQITTQAAMARPWWRTRLHHPVNSDPISAPASGRRVEQADHAGAPAEQPDPEGGEHRPGHAEDHGVEVDPVGGRQQLLAAQVAEPLGHRAQAHRGSPARRDQRRQEQGGDQGHREGGHVDAVDRAQADGGDEHPGQRRPGHQGQLLDGGLQGDGRGHVLLVDQHGQGGPPRRPVHPLEPRSRPGADEQRPQRRMGERSVDHQASHRGGHGQLGQIRTFRRSIASASVPPHRAPASSGTSWARPIRPTTSVEWVNG